MEITKEKIKHIAKLSMLKLKDSEIEEFTKQLNKIIEYFNIIQKLDLIDIDTTEHIAGLKNITRPDKTKDLPYKKEVIFKNVPNIENNQIKVPKILQTEE